MEDKEEDVTKGRSAKFWRTFHSAINIIVGMLDLHGPHNRTTLWRTFRSALTNEKGLDGGFRDSENFKLGLYRVCCIADIATEIDFNFSDDERKARDRDKSNKAQADALVEDLLDDSKAGDNGDHESIINLIEALEVISQNASYHGLHEEDLIELRIFLNTISNCHQMVIKAALEEKRRPVMAAA